MPRSGTTLVEQIIASHNEVFGAGELVYLQSIIKNKGFSGLYQGLIPTYIRIFPCLAIQFWCLEKGKSIFDNIV